MGRVDAASLNERLIGGWIALRLPKEVGALCPDESALLVPREGGILALADGAIRMPDGPIVFVPEQYMGNDPEAVKSGLRAAYARIVDTHEFDHLLLAHGLPGSGAASRLCGNSPADDSPRPG